MDEREIRTWTRQSRMSDPGRHGGAISRLPAGAAPLTRIVQGLLIHAEELDAYGVAAPRPDASRRATLPVADRLAILLADVPRPLFQTAGQAWSAWRTGREDPARYRHGTACGPWFVKVDVVRDHLALNGREVSAWDGWRDAPPERRAVAAEELERLDRIAAHPGLPDGGMVPDWLAEPAT